MKQDSQKNPHIIGQVACDCGYTKFELGVAVDAIGNNFIRVIECIKCNNQMPVPFKSFVSNPPGPTVPATNVTKVQS